VNKTTVVAPVATTKTDATGGVVATMTNPGTEANSANNWVKVTAENTTSSTAVEVDKNVPASVSITRSENNNALQVRALNGWTGRLSVAVVENNAGTEIESFVEVVINPVPVSEPKIIIPPLNNGFVPNPNNPQQPLVPATTLTWKPSPSQVIEYVVKVNEKQVCVTTETSCEVKQLIGPRTKVEVVASGNDNTYSVPTKLPSFKATRPVPALVVNFATAKYELSPKFKADLQALAKTMVKEGFTRVVISGHTDTAGKDLNYDNQTLSEQRSKVTLAYLRSFVPKLRSVEYAYAFNKLAADESTPEGMYTNRRAEVFVW
jgi:outer membrane protein OmpA-like peptidoglycan-associated protein